MFGLCVDKMFGYNQKKSNRKKYYGGEFLYVEVGISDLRVEMDNFFEKDISFERNNGQLVNYVVSSDEVVFVSLILWFLSGLVFCEGLIFLCLMFFYILGL